MERTVTLSGTTSAFAYPLLTRWVGAFQQDNLGTRINLKMIGSGSGISQVENGSSDFAVSEAITSGASRRQPSVIQIPVAAAPVCITYNIPGVSQAIQLSPSVLAGIFRGTVKTWRDPLIVQSNPGIALPDLPILVVHDQVTNGATGILTAYLAQIGADGKPAAGAPYQEPWPAVLSAVGSEGVLSAVQAHPGAIGYVALAYAEQARMPEARIENAAGSYVAPTMAATTADVQAFAFEWSKNPGRSLVNPPPSAEDAYPIAGMVFLTIPKNGADLMKQNTMKSFAQFMIDDEQSMSEALHYSILPDTLECYANQQLARLTARFKLLQKKPPVCM